MRAQVKADVGTNPSDGALPKMEALPSDLLSQITFDCRGFQDSRDRGALHFSSSGLDIHNVDARSNLVVAVSTGTLPAAQISPLRENFDAISVRVPFNGKFFDVAVPNEMFDKSRSDQTAIAGKIGGDIGPRELNRAVANYLLDREAFDLLAKEKVGTITEEQKEVLELHRAKWQEDKAAEDRAKAAGEITNKEAALLKVYRDKWVRDSEGGLDVVGVRVRGDGNDYYYDLPSDGALVVCPSAESK